MLQRRSRTDYLLVLLVLLLAWVLLLFRLDQVPPGLQHDQSFSIRDALQIVSGHFPIYFPDNFGRGPLFMYSAALIMSLVDGHLLWSLRFAAVAWGMAGLATTYVLARRNLPPTAAWMATGLVAGSFWFLLAARLGVESIALLSLATATFYFLDRGLARGKWSDFAIAGLLAGVANYTYLAARTLYALPPLMALYLAGRMLWVRCSSARSSGAVSEIRRSLAGLAVMSGLALIVSAPLLIYLRTHPDTDGRIGELSNALRAALAGDPGPVLSNTWETFRSILSAGPISLPYYYGLPGRPALQPVWALALLVGIWVTLVRLKQPYEFLPLAALGLGLGANLLTGADALYMRAIYALPLLFILAVRGLWAVAALLRTRLGTRSFAKRRLARATLLAGLLLWQAADNGWAYFSTWAHAEPTQRIYNADFRAIAGYVDLLPSSMPVFIGTDRLLDLDSETYRYYEPRRSDVGWFALPDSPPLPVQGSAVYVLPVPAELSPSLAALTSIQRDRTFLKVPPGGNELAQAFRLDAADISRTLQSWGSQPPAEPVVYGDCLRLSGAALHAEGGLATLVTWWSVTAPWPRATRPGYAPARPKFSIVLTDALDYTWAQVDQVTSLPFQTWQPGQHVLELMGVPLPGDLPPGAYRVRLAIYDDEQGALPVSVNGRAISDAPVITSAYLLMGQPGNAPQPPHLLNQAAEQGVLHALGAWEAPDLLIGGVPAYLHVSWQAQQSFDTTGLRFALRGRTENGTLLWQQADSLAQSLPEVWPARETWRLTHRLVPETTVPEDQTVIEICAETDHAAPSCAQLPPVRVVHHQPVLVLAVPPRHLVDARWGDYLTLVGYDLQTGSRAISMTLYWRVEGDLPGPVKRFVHAATAGGVLAGQSDDVLQNDGIPPKIWQPGEYLTDRATVVLSGDVPVREVRVGLYDPETGDRLQVILSGGGAAPDRQIIIPLD